MKSMHQKARTTTGVVAVFPSLFWAVGKLSENISLVRKFLPIVFQNATFWAINFHLE